jgi:cysteine desulfurase
LAGIAVSAGAACSSGKVKQSHVLKAMNLPDELINNTIRISFGWQNTHEDVDRLIEVWLKLYKESN